MVSCLLVLILGLMLQTLSCLSATSPSASTRLSSHLSPASAQPTAHIFLIAGQSNSVGYNTDPFIPEDGPNPRILQLQCCTANLTSLPPSQCFLNISADPLQPCATGSHVSFARSFSRSLLAAMSGDGGGGWNDGDVIVLVPTGISGTGFIDGVWPAYTGTGFKAAIAMLQRTWQLLGSDNSTTVFNRSFDGVLWHQGTLDAGDNSQHFAANASYHLNHNLIPLIAALRNTSYIHFSSPTLPFLLSQMLPSWMDNSTHPERQGVKEAIAMLTQFVPYAGFADSYGLLGDPVFRSGSDNEVIHFTARSQRILGKRYYAAYEAALLNYPEQPPTASRALNE